MISPVAATSIEINSTITDSFTTTLFAGMESKNLTVTGNLISFAATVSPSDISSTIATTDNAITLNTRSTSNIYPTITTTDDTIALTMQLISSSSSTVVTTGNQIAQSTLNGSSAIITPTLISFTANSNNSTSSSATLFIVVGLLSLLLTGSTIIFCTVLYMYRWKRYAAITIIQMLKLTLYCCFYSTGKYADIKFLKMSKEIKMVCSNEILTHNDSDCYNRDLC